MSTETTQTDGEYVPLSPMQKVKERLSDPEIPLGRLLHYMHGQSQVPRPIRDLVDLARTLEEHSTALMQLTGEEGLLMTPPGSQVESSAEVMVQIRKLRSKVRTHLEQSRAVIQKMTEEDG